MEISVETTINAGLESVWSSWTTPNDIMKWNFASDDWCCPNAENDFKVGGRFNYRMEAKDGSAGFDFEGKYTSIKEKEHIEYMLDDNRRVKIIFSESKHGIRVLETFEAEDMHGAEQQKQGWQSILNNFKKRVEATSN